VRRSLACLKHLADLELLGRQLAAPLAERGRMLPHDLEIVGVRGFAAGGALKAAARSINLSYAYHIQPVERARGADRQNG
jgi:hypothetical protein